MHRLSPREQEVVELLVQGYRNREIAEQLDIAEETVKTHVRRALARLGARNRAHLAAIWEQEKARNWQPPPCD